MRSIIVLILICEISIQAQLYFKSGYEPGTTQDAGFITYTGTDNSTGYNWNVLSSGQVKGISGAQNYYWDCGVPGVDAYGKIVDDPAGNKGKILQATVVRDDGGTVCRFEYEEMFTAPDTATRCVRYDYMLDSSWNSIKTASVNTWLLISEIWSQGGVNDRASIPLYINKSGSSFSWEIILRWTNGNYTTAWSVTNSAVPVPVGKWVNAVMLFKPGLAGAGRFYFSIDGTVVFDIKDKDMIWNNRAWAYWSCQKLYMGTAYIDYLRNRGTPATCYYDNYEVWGDLPVSTSTASFDANKKIARAEFEKNASLKKTVFDGARSMILVKTQAGKYYSLKGSMISPKQQANRVSVLTDLQSGCGD